MSTFRLAMLPLWILAASLALALSGCLTIQEGTTCAVAGKISDGAICSHLISASTENLSFGETVDLLEAQGERTCVPVPGMSVCADDQSAGVAVKLPARGAAIVMSAADWGTMKTELETACREMGKACSYAAKQMILAMNRVVR